MGTLVRNGLKEKNKLINDYGKLEDGSVEVNWK